MPIHTSQRTNEVIETMFRFIEVRLRHVQDMGRAGLLLTLRNRQYIFPTKQKFLFFLGTLLGRSHWQLLVIPLIAVEGFKRA